MRVSVWIGFDPREAAAFAVARASIRRNVSSSVQMRGLSLADLRRRGLYCRPTELRPSAADRPVLWDVISDAPMSTEHACARFVVPFLAAHDVVESDWSVFADGDVMARGSLDDMLEDLDPGRAVYCVKHRYEPAEQTKMEGQPQTFYSRKNWSSVMIFNCRHPANEPVVRDLKLVNSLPGRDLHRFCWLDDSEIGELDPTYNYLVGVTSPRLVPDPRLVHFTRGVPDMLGYEDCEYADEWRRERDEWASSVL